MVERWLLVPRLLPNLGLTGRVCRAQHGGPVIPALGRLKQEDYREFEAILNYRVKSCLKKIQEQFIELRIVPIEHSLHSYQFVLHQKKDSGE